MHCYAVGWIGMSLLYYLGVTHARPAAIGYTELPWLWGDFESDDDHIQNALNSVCNAFGIARCIKSVMMRMVTSKPFCLDPNSQVKVSKLTGQRLKLPLKFLQNFKFWLALSQNYHTAFEFASRLLHFVSNRIEFACDYIRMWKGAIFKPQL